MVDNCCRLCLQSLSEQVLQISLFSSVGERVLASTYKELCGICIQSDDDLPKVACLSCVENIEIAYGVRQKCIESDKLLREIVSSMKSFERITPVVHDPKRELPDRDGEEEVGFDAMEDFSQNIYNVEASSMILQENDEFSALVNSENNTLLLSADQILPIGFLEMLNSCSRVPAQVDEPKSCCGCELSFQTEADLQEHSLEAHYSDRIICDAKPHECSVCYKRFTDASSLALHANKRTLCHRCRFCEKRFNDRKQLQFHEKYHRRKYTTKEETCECKFCGRTFRFRSSLMAHVRLHTVDTNEQLFKCNQCERQFIRRTHLRSHEISHSDQTPFGCSLCALKFKRKQHLTAHLKIHEGNDQAYKCRHCGLAFKHQSTRAYHEVTKHTGNYPFTCDICGRNFFRKPFYDKHMERHNKN